MSEEKLKKELSNAEVAQLYVDAAKRPDYFAAEYLIRTALVAKIPPEYISFPQAQVKARLDPKWVADPKVDEILTRIYNPEDNWARTRRVIIVDGGTKPNRDAVGHACLYRSVVSNAPFQVSSALAISVTDLVLEFQRFSKTDDGRFSTLDRLLKIQCLMLREMDEKIQVNERKGGTMFLESLFDSRQTMNRSTIVTMTEEKDKFNTGHWGRTFQSLVAAKEIDDEDVKVWHLRCQGNG